MAEKSAKPKIFAFIALEGPEMVYHNDAEFGTPDQKITVVKFFRRKCSSRSYRVNLTKTG